MEFVVRFYADGCPCLFRKTVVASNVFDAIIKCSIDFKESTLGSYWEDGGFNVECLTVEQYDIKYHR